MPKLIDRLLSPRTEQRYSLSDYAALLDDLTYSFNGVSYPLTQTWTMSGNQKSEPPSRAFGALYKSNGPVFACVAFRASVFSEARFQFQQLSNGRPGNLFGTQDLALLETPWANGTTGDLLARMSVDTDLGGNFYAVNEGDALRRLRPDWVEIVLSAPADQYDAEPIGYLYHPGGVGFSKQSQSFGVDEVVHWAPKPDPDASYRGMSPLQPVLLDLQADKGASLHKQKFFDNAATPNMVIKFDPMVSKENFDMWREAFKDDHEGARNAYKTMFLGGGADVQVVGRDFSQINLKEIMGAGETRIAAAFEVPPVLVGFSEGLDSATYSNYGMARRRYADATERPRWRSACAALQKVVVTPPGARLWYDGRDISFLQEDEKDAAEIKMTEASTMKTLLDAGFTSATVVDAVTSGDYSRLKHSGLFSVQLQPPGTQFPASKVAFTTN